MESPAKTNSAIFRKRIDNLLGACVFLVKIGAQSCPDDATESGNVGRRIDDPAAFEDIRHTVFSRKKFHDRKIIGNHRKNGNQADKKHHRNREH